MGDRLDEWQFTPDDYRRFSAVLVEETERLGDWFVRDRFTGGPTTVGYEMELCLVDENFQPADANLEVLARLDMPQAVPELARCNLEFNGTPQALAGDGLQRIEAEMQGWLAGAREVAREMGLHVILIGMLPTLREQHMSLQHISPSPRYQALNAGVAALRGRPDVCIDIRGHETYQGRYDSIMPESAATSLQLHIALEQASAVRWYNAAQIAAGPLLAVAANAPYLFGKDLWAETRVPVFAQAVDAGDVHYVTFGRGYVRESLFELFEENLKRFPVLLPARREQGGVAHALLHNGTVWRWNRPVIGIAPGEPAHLRLEHRSLPCGPSVSDMIANSAFFYGLTGALAEMETAPENQLEFADARANFYRAARYGLDAHMQWFDGRSPAPELFVEQLLPLARQGLARYSVDARLAEDYLQIIAARVRRGLSGAGWQRAWVARHGRDMPAMLAAYAERQESGAPVSEWPL